jgi:hypothetical protein
MEEEEEPHDDNDDDENETIILGAFPKIYFRPIKLLREIPFLHPHSVIKEEILVLVNSAVLLSYHPVESNLSSFIR